MKNSKPINAMFKALDKGQAGPEVIPITDDFMKQAEVKYPGLLMAWRDSPHREHNKRFVVILSAMAGNVPRAKELRDPEVREIIAAIGLRQLKRWEKLLREVQRVEDLAQKKAKKK